MKTNKHRNLQLRINRFLKHFKDRTVLPVHPDDIVGAVALRKAGLIPNMDIKVLGGELFPCRTVQLEVAA